MIKSWYILFKRKLTLNKISIRVYLFTGDTVNWRNLYKWCYLQASQGDPALKCVFTQPLYHQQGMIQGQFLCTVLMVWIQSFTFPRPVTLPKLKNTAYPTIYLWLWKKRWVHVFLMGISIKWVLTVLSWIWT